MDILSVFSDFSISPIRLYFVSFVLGSFSVATLSDIKHMTAKREFLEIWAIIFLFAISYEGYLVWNNRMDYLPFALKWGIILFFAFISYEGVGIYFRIAIGDVLACIAAAAVFPAALALIFFLVLKAVNLVLRPFLGVVGDRSGYPFMPVIFVSVILAVGIAFWLSGFPAL